MKKNMYTDALESVRATDAFKEKTLRAMRKSDALAKPGRRSRIPARLLAASLCALLLAGAALAAVTRWDSLAEFLGGLAIGDKIQSHLQTPVSLNDPDAPAPGKTHDGIEVKVTGGYYFENQLLAFFTVTDTQGKGRVPGNLGFEVRVGPSRDKASETGGGWHVSRLDYDVSQNSARYIVQFDGDIESSKGRIKLRLYDMKARPTQEKGLPLGDMDAYSDYWRNAPKPDPEGGLSYPLDINAVCIENGLPAGKLFSGRDFSDLINDGLAHRGAGYVSDISFTENGLQIIRKGGGETACDLYYTDAGGKEIRADAVEAKGFDTIYRFSGITGQEQLDRLTLRADIDSEGFRVKGSWDIDFALPPDTSSLVYEIGRKYSFGYLESVVVSPLGVAMRFGDPFDYSKFGEGEFYDAKGNPIHFGSDGWNHISYKNDGTGGYVSKIISIPYELELNLLDVEELAKIKIGNEAIELK